MKVLIPAMEKRSSIVVARSLGRKGVKVIGCSDKKFNAGFFSKYCHKKYVYVSPLKNINRYLEDIKNIIEKEKPDVFLPINEETLIPLLKQRDYFEKRIKIPLPSNEIIEKTFDKLESLKIAQRLGIPCARLVKNDSKNISYPVIIRSRHSREIKGNKIIAKKLSYVFSSKDIVSDPDFFAQEYVPGKGYGFYALFNKGVPKAYFMLERINEVPFFGGPSSLREAIYKDKLKNYGMRILKELNWHGVAMVEFRKDKRDNQFKFIEINPRFWGSLSLAVHAGIDFPYLLFQIAQNQQIGEHFDYKRGIKCRWLFGDFSYFLSVLFGKKIDGRPSRLKAFLEFFRFFDKNLYYDYFDKDDLKPALIETLISFKKLFKKNN